MKLYNEQDVATIQKYINNNKYEFDLIEDYAELTSNREIYVKGVTISYMYGSPTHMLKDDVTTKYFAYWKNTAVGTFLIKDIRKHTKSANGDIPYGYIKVKINNDTYKVLVRLLFELDTKSKVVIPSKKKSEEPISEYEEFKNNYLDFYIDGQPYTIIKMMYDGEELNQRSRFDEYIIDAKESEIEDDDNCDSNKEEPICDVKDEFDEYDDSMNINLFEDE